MSGRSGPGAGETRQINQCDGCARGLPVEGGIHRGEGYDMIGCTKDRYEETTLEMVARIIAKHRRHVELSPGAGESHQRYALATLDDVESDTRAAMQEAQAHV